MSKLTIIQLLNKIANGEEVPKKIKINNVIYEYRGYMYCTEKANYQDIEDYLFGKWNFNILNEEVEIIEEDKKIEKIIPTSLKGIDNLDEKIEVSHIDTISAIDKINEIIDKLNEGE